MCARDDGQTNGEIVGRIDHAVGVVDECVRAGRDLDAKGIGMDNLDVRRTPLPDAVTVTFDIVNELPLTFMPNTRLPVAASEPWSVAAEPV